MWPFKRRTRPAASPTDAVPDHASHLRTVLDDDRASLTDALRTAASPKEPMRPGIALVKLIPFEKVFTGLFSFLRDPNGKISSKRTGAGALVGAGIYMLYTAQTGYQFAGGCVCITAAVVLFYFTKLETPE